MEKEIEQAEGYTRSETIRAIDRRISTMEIVAFSLEKMWHDALAQRKSKKLERTDLHLRINRRTLTGGFQIAWYLVVPHGHRYLSLPKGKYRYNLKRHSKGWEPWEKIEDIAQGLRIEVSALVKARTMLARLEKNEQKNNQ